MSEQPSDATAAEIWQLFRETRTQFQEVAERFQETDRRFQETAKRFQETDRRFQESDEKLRRLEGLFGMQWGRLLEALVAPSALDLFRSRGINVRHIYPRAQVHQNGESREFDLLLEDGNDVVVVEVKSTLRVGDVNDFLDDLREFTRYFPRYRGYHIYGAVTGLEIAEEADRYAYRRGLFVLRVSGDGLVEIVNDADFRPRDFGDRAE